MTLSGILLLGGFVLLAAFMVMRILPTLLALPIMAAWIAFIAGVPFFDWLSEIMVKGAFRLSAPIVLVVFGAMFARIIQKTGISDAIIKKAAELSGDQPIAIAALMTAATAFIFLGMSGLGAVIMIGSIAIPIMTGAGIAAIDAVILILLGMLTGSALNFAGAATGIGIFGAEAVLRYIVPGAIVSVTITCAYIALNIPRGKNAGASAITLMKNFILAVLSVPGSLISVIGKLFSKKKATLIKKKETLPSAALISPILPLVVIGVLNFTVGLGNTADGKVDPIAAAVLGFVVASFYAAILVRPSQAINLFTGSIVDGIKDVAGVIFLFMGIGMLVTATTQKAAIDILNPLFVAVMPNTFYGVLLLFTVLAPAALYRGPFNMYGMGTGIAAILTSLNVLPATALYGMFSGVGYLQAIADPTNSHNTWLSGFAGVDATSVMKRILPYAWGGCVLMMIFVAVLQ
ncbi:transporter [Anaerovibrio sp.]|uniref:transporter n=1 Tax=Anaerovibrio sp. TaxID=1872532 RepID=UPI0025BD5AD4|nr:transporter [Anaerovibrio sp.]MBR2141665.1 transporter [Anaerovibrio sp.]